MPSKPVLPVSHSKPFIKMMMCAGAAAGNVTCTGIKKDDEIIQVVAFTFPAAGAVPTGMQDLTAEFTATATDTINNTGGTSTANKGVLVIWARTADALGST